MKKYLFILALLMTIFAPTILSAQTTDPLLDLLKQKNTSRSFADLDAYLAKNNTDFDNNDEVVKLFNQERVRLGANFETELWKYLGEDLRKHYWVSSFVETKEYLNGNSPLPELAKKIRSNAQNFAVKPDDYEGLGMKFTILREVVVDLYLDKNLASAKTLKQKAERIYKDIEQYAVVGAAGEYILCIYDNLEKNPGSCKKENSEEPSSAPQTDNSGSNIISGGVLNGRAVSLPAPAYPPAARAVGASGAVNVNVVIDEAGNVISAEALSGHALLRQAAVDAAKQAKFSPFKLDGKLTKVTGTIVYNFSK